MRKETKGTTNKMAHLGIQLDVHEAAKAPGPGAVQVVWPDEFGRGKAAG